MTERGASDVYTHGHDESVLRSHTWRTIENSAAYLEHLLIDGAHLLDIGCGPGNLTADFAQRIGTGRAVGVDVSDDIVARASADHPAAAHPNLRFETGDAYALDFEDDSFDVVHMHQVLQHVTAPVDVLCEAARVCRPGGTIAAREADYSAMSWYPALDELDRWLAAYLAVCRHNDAEPDAARHLLRWTRVAGFTDVRASASVWCFATVDDREWWGGLWSDRVLLSTLAEQAIDYRVATRKQLEEMSTGWRRWAADPDAWFLVPHGEVLVSLQT